MIVLKREYIPAVLWSLCILLATNNRNFLSLLLSQDIGFNLQLTPDLSDLLIITDIHFDSIAFLFSKAGHVVSFGILYLLLAWATADNRKAIIFSILFAFFTEILQLFFERSGRFSDVLIDLVGVYLAYRLSIYIKVHRGLGSALQKRYK